MTPVTPDAVAVELVKARLPVFYMDACGLLDIILAPLRDNPETAFAASNILPVGRPSLVSIVVTEQVQYEYNLHRGEVANEVRRELKKVEKRLGHYESISRELIGAVAPRLSLVPKWDSAAFPLLDLADRMIQSAFHVAEDHAAVILASRRALDKAPPWNPGEYADCHIIEHVLAVARAVSVTSPSPLHQCFISSNKNDYGGPGHMRSPLNTEFKAAGLQFALDLAHAKSMAGV